MSLVLLLMRRYMAGKLRIIQTISRKAEASAAASNEHIQSPHKFQGLSANKEIITGQSEDSVDERLHNETAARRPTRRGVRLDTDLSSTNSRVVGGDPFTGIC